MESRPDRHKLIESFKEGVSSVFRQWTALELAVDQRWGGPYSQMKADNLLTKVIELFLGSKKVYVDVSLYHACVGLHICYNFVLGYCRVIGRLHGTRIPNYMRR